MNFYNFIVSLFPTFKRDDILDAAIGTRKSIMEHSLTAYESADQVWGKTPFTSKEIKGLEKQYKSEVGISTRQSMIGDILFALQNSLKVLDYVVQKGKVIYSDNEASAGLTFQKATILRVVSVSDFVNKYSLDLLNYIHVCETKDTDAGKDIEGISKAEEEMVISQFMDFCVAIRVLKVNMESLEKALAELPDATVSDLTEKTFISTMGAKKIDPLNLRGFSVRKNPIFIFGMLEAEKQEKKYKAKKEMLELIQLRLMNLQKIRDKKQDASLDKEIEYYQSRVTGLNHEIEKMNKEYGL